MLPPNRINLALELSYATAGHERAAGSSATCSQVPVWHCLAGAEAVAARTVAHNHQGDGGSRPNSRGVIVNVSGAKPSLRNGVAIPLLDRRWAAIIESARRRDVACPLSSMRISSNRVELP